MEHEKACGVVPWCGTQTPTASGIGRRRVPLEMQDHLTDWRGGIPSSFRPAIALESYSPKSWSKH
jgi:hypothetical protein